MFCMFAWMCVHMSLFVCLHGCVRVGLCVVSVGVRVRAYVCVCGVGVW